jgi:molybdate transport system substrate-binding protein
MQIYPASTYNGFTNNIYRQRQKKNLMSFSLKLVVSTGMNVVLQELLPLYEAETGNSIISSYDSSSLILKRLECGEVADVILLTRDALDGLAQRELVMTKSLVSLAKSGIGVIVRAGKQHPDISSEATFLKSIEMAQSIAYTSAGASGIYFTDLVRRLGIKEIVEAKSITQPGGRIAGLVATGKAEMGIQLESELVGMPGVEYVGSLPKSLQLEVVFGAAIFSQSTKVEQSVELIQFLCRPEYAEIYSKNGMHPLG